MQLSVIDALSVMAQALSINSVDVTKLTALSKNSQTSEDVDDIIAAGAPAATVHRSHSWPIAETLEDRIPTPSRSVQKPARPRRRGR